MSTNKKKSYTHNVEDIFDTYDFECCKFAIIDGIIFFTEEAREDALGKWLRIAYKNNPYLYPRVGKYLKKGYTPKCETSLGIFNEFCSYVQGWEIYDPKLAAEQHDIIFGGGYRLATPKELQENMQNIFTSFFGILDGSGDYDG